MIETKASNRGFTLVELMVVVVIIGILSTIAAATYKRFIKRSRLSEAITHLHDIKAKQEAYRGRFDRYATVCGVGCSDFFYPTATTMGAKHAWDPGAAGFWNGFAALGFDKNERLYFQYGTVSDGRDPGNIAGPSYLGLPAGAEWFCVAARAKFDNNVDNDVYVELTSHTDTAWRIGLGENTAEVIPNSPCSATGAPNSSEIPSGTGSGGSATTSGTSAATSTGQSASNTAQGSTAQGYTGEKGNTSQTGNTAQANTTQTGSAAQANTTQVNTAQTGNTTQANTAQQRTGGGIRAQRNTTQRNTTQQNTAQQNTVQQNTAQANTTQRNTAQQNTTQRSNNMMQQRINLVR